jgi:hypothetical protein
LLLIQSPFPLASFGIRYIDLVSGERTTKETESRTDGDTRPGVSDLVANDCTKTRAKRTTTECPLLSGTHTVAFTAAQQNGQTHNYCNRSHMGAPLTL